MPVTNRGVVQLTPSTTLTTTTRKLSSGFVPSLETIQSGLAVFGLFIIVRYCATRAYVWLRRLYGADMPTSLGSTTILPEYQQQDQRALWALNEKPRPENWTGDSNSYDAGFGEADMGTESKKLSIDPNWTVSEDSNGSRPRRIMSRPPPAPPLTPPELSTAVFTFDNLPQGQGSDSFMIQPNPDYISSTTSSVAPLAPSESHSPAVPRRRSYNRTLPINIPNPQSPTSFATSEVTFSPHSYPPSNPTFPPMLPTTGATDVDVQGEIVGVLDGEGAGWTRHTRVYGGGVCLACAASGGDHNGGFYGATVPPEEKR
ncbi:hypothetical protein G7046_g8267 [Stylonectria norvegica]|nr:hypothetical protein G7046_g8267 [Stylonectria norvegica]